MMKTLFRWSFFLVLLFASNRFFSQTAPNLGAASGFAVFTSTGNISNTGGGTDIGGDIGTNSGTITGFPPGNVVGTSHVVNGTSASAATNASSAYSFLSGQACGAVLGTALGGGQVLTPNVYCITGNSTLTGTLVLDGQNNPNSIFIIKINGNLTTAASSRVNLINLASICNVYWQINGQVTIGSSSIFRGTFISNGLINLQNGAAIFGRALSLGGNITLQNTDVTIGLPPVASTIAANGSTTLCAGGSVTLTGNVGGTWSTGPTTSSIVVNASGNYYVTNTTNCGSVTSNTISVVINPQPTLSVNSGSVCKGSSITLTVSGANTYSWAPGASLSATTGTSVIASPTVTTVYSVTGTSAAGCSKTNTTLVTVLSTPTITVNSATFCAGNSATLIAGGATTFTWSPAAGLSATTGATVVANPTTTTIYTVSGTAGSCTAMATATVMINPSPSISVSSGTMCPGGSVTLTASGANTFTWSPGTGLSATTGATVTANPTITTTYTVTGTSLAGCVNTGTTSVTVLPNLTLTISTATICIGNSATLTANGAATYSWDPSSGLSSTTGATVVANPTVTTVYTVTGTAGSCSVVGTTTVTVNPLPTVSITPNGPTTFCQGDSVTLMASQLVSYLWSTGANTQTITVSLAGDYSVTATDGNGCSASASIAIQVNPLPTLTVNTGVICNGSSATLTAGGANTFTWSPATGLSATTGASVAASPTTTTIYTVTGTSSLGCVNYITTTVTVVPSLTLTVNSATICYGSSATLTANGANTYSWDPATGLNATTGSSVVASPTATTIYTVTATAGVCTATQTATVTVNPLPTVTISSSGATTFCQGDSVTLMASQLVSYQWSTGATTQTINVSAPGDYSVIATDGNGCSSTASVSIFVNPLPTITVNSGTICAGSSITLTASGADTYTWSPGTGLSATSGASVIATPAVTTNYTITGTNTLGCVSNATTSVTVLSNPTLSINSATLCSGSPATLTANGANTYSWDPPSGLSSTTGSAVIASPTITTVYTVTGTINGCSAVEMTTVTVYPLPTASISVSGATTFCQGGSATLTASSGTSYLWSTSATTQSIIVTASGNYSVTITDGNGCSATTSVTTIIVDPLPTPTVSASGSTTLCQGDYVILTASGGSSYLWSNGATTSTIMVSSAGNYSVLVTASNGCSATSSVVTVVVNLLPTATIAVSGPTVFCQGGSATLTSSPGASYLWSNSATTQSIVVSTTGDYTVKVTDANGCSATSAVTSVSVLAAPYVNLGPDTTACGCIFLTAFNPGATYLWSNGQDYSMIKVCSSGTYWVNASNGVCITSDTIQVTIHPAPVVNIAIVTGSIVTLNAGNPGASYLWNTGATTQTIIATTPGVYYVTVTNQFNCIGSDTIMTGVLGINESGSSSLPFMVYPNPSHDKSFSLTFEINESSTVEIRLVNILGSVVHYEQLKNFIGLYDKKLDLPYLEKGIYFVEVINGTRRKALKIALD